MLVGHEFSSVEDVVIGAVGKIFFEFGLGGFDEHVGHEESVVGTSANDSDFDPVFRAPSGISINNIDFSSGVEVALG